jgi:hypothetical protein
VPFAHVYSYSTPAPVLRHKQLLAAVVPAPAIPASKAVWLLIRGSLFQHLDELLEQGGVIMPGTGADHIAVHQAVPIYVLAADLRNIEGALATVVSVRPLRQPGRSRNLDAMADHRHRLVGLEKVSGDPQQVLIVA